MTGQAEVISAQTINNLVEKEAHKITVENRRSCLRDLNKGKLNIKLGKANIYSLKDDELELYADAIQVKKQKPKRSSVGSKENKSEAKGPKQEENKSPVIVEIDTRKKLTLIKMDVKDIKEDDQLNRKRVNTDLVVLKKP